MNIQSINQSIFNNKKINFKSKQKNNEIKENIKYFNNEIYRNIKSNIILPLILSQGLILSMPACKDKNNENYLYKTEDITNQIEISKKESMIKEAMSLILQHEQPEETLINKDELEIDNDVYEQIENNTYKNGKKTINIEKLPSGHYNIIYKNKGISLFNHEVKLFGNKNLVVTFNRNGQILSMEDAARVNRNRINDDFLILNPISKEMNESITKTFKRFASMLYDEKDIIAGNVVSEKANILECHYIGSNSLFSNAHFSNKFFLKNTFNWKTDSKIKNYDIRVNLKTNGSYDVIFTKENAPEFNNDIYVASFDETHKNVKYKIIDQPESYDEIIEKEEKKLKVKQKNGEEFVKDMVELPIFKTMSNDVLKKLVTAIGLKDLEYVDNGNELYNIFLKKGNDSFDISLKQTGAKTYTGIAQRLMPDGTSQIYLIKLEHIETNKSNKLRISRMRVVQDGLEANAPTYKKNLKETHKHESNKLSMTHDANGKSRINMLIPMIPDFLHPGIDYQGDITSKVIKTIDEVISETNSDGKIVTVYSVSKDTEMVEMNGQSIF